MLEINSSTKVGFMLKMKVKMVRFIQSKYPKLYESINIKDSRKWKENEMPWTTLKQPLKDCNVALVTSGGIILKEQDPFDLNDPNGDCSYREISKDSTHDQIVISHMYYDSSDVKVDTEVMFPLYTLKRFLSEGKIGRINSRHYSFSGGIGDPTPLIEKTAPEVARNLVNDQVDLAILTPA